MEGRKNWEKLVEVGEGDSVRNGGISTYRVQKIPLKKSTKIFGVCTIL